MRSARFRLVDGKMGEMQIQIGPRSNARRLAVALFAASVVAALAIAGIAATSDRQAAAPGVPVIVRALPGERGVSEAAVRRAGGVVTRSLPIISGFAARVPRRALPTLRRAPGVEAVWPDARVRPAELDERALAAYDSVVADSGWQAAVHLDGARRVTDGSGIGIAVLDTGVADVPSLTARVADRVDFTAEGDGLDHFGHGTHMAGLIAGDALAPDGTTLGVAPGARIISVKVAPADGSTDVSVVLAALQWIIAQRTALDIRVLNLAFGTDGVQSAAIDPLDYAVEAVWQSGIVVVVAAGNRGPAPATVDKPGDDPYVLTVGAEDGTSGTPTVAAFSGVGPTSDGYSKPDLLAPGVSIVSLRAPGSTIDLARPAAIVDAATIKGTGTSQATAIVSGIAALVLAAAPELTPDQVKTVLVGTGEQSVAGSLAPLVDAERAVTAAAAGDVPTPSVNDGLNPSTGIGSLEASRGTVHVAIGPPGALTPVVGEVTVLGTPWDATTWSSLAWNALAWSPWAWSSVGWIGWDAKTWSAKTWSAKTWSGVAWIG